MSVADDYGRFFAHPSILRSYCFPLKLDKFSEANVKRMLIECVSARLLVTYNAGKHLFIVNFRQQTRGASKFPEPSQDELLSKCEANAKQMRSESESESETNTETGNGSTTARCVFVSPSLEAIQLQAAKIGLPTSEAKGFWNYYESNGWRVGKNKMHSWPHALSGWKSRWQEKRNPTVNIRQTGGPI